VENYQITLGGDGTEDAVIGEKTGPGFAYTEIVPAIERILRAYLDLRLEPSETFLQAFRRLGMEPFKAATLRGRRRKRCRVTGTSRARGRAGRGAERPLSHHSATAVLEHALKDDDLGRVALVSSFGAESVVLLHLVSVIAPETPVLFIDTRMLFQKRWTISASWPRSFTSATSAPFAPPSPRGVRGPGQHAAPVQHRRLLQRPQGGTAGTRAFDFRRLDHRPKALPERRPGHDRLFREPKAISGSRSTRWPIGVARILRNTWSKTACPGIRLVAKGFPSIGCAPCTSPVKPGEDPRAGRWRGQAKTECGIHFIDGKAVRTPKGERSMSVIVTDSRLWPRNRR
jgi:phosphoadenosine phosphosulfate reductase